MNEFYVYIHFRKDNLQPFYVGKGSGERFKCKQGRNPRWNNIVNKVGYVAQIMENNLTEAKSFELEEYYIKVLGREDLNEGSLCNMSNGGEGISGHKFSEVSKKKMSESKKNISEETRKKMSDTRKGNPTWNKNKINIYSPETLAKMSKNAAKKKQVMNIETGEIFDSIKQLSIKLNMDYDKLKYIINRCKSPSPYKLLEETETNTRF